MISKRNYFSISILMFVVLFMFQFTYAARDALNDYQTNRFAIEAGELPSGSEAFNPEVGSVGTQSQRDYVLCIGDRESPVGRTAYAWAQYSKQGVAFYQDAASCQEADGHMVVIDSKQVNWTEFGEVEALSSLVERGVDLVFCGLPEPEVIAADQALRRLLGIRRVVEEGVALKGIRIYKGFLLGGEAVYQAGTPEEEKKQDLELEVPWYGLGTGTAVYMQGIPAEGPEDVAEQNPAILWSKSSGSGYVFVVNGGYMEDAVGIGLLSAFSAQASPYMLYPVVNAQTLVVANYPGLSDENPEVIDALYSQNMTGFLRDLVWPDLGAVYEQNHLGVTYMMSPQYDYTDDSLPQAESFTYYMRLINEQHGEAGLSTVNFSGTDLMEKWEADQEFMGFQAPDYRFTSLFAGSVGLESLLATCDQQEMLGCVRTVVAEYTGGSDIFGYLNSQVTWQRVVADGMDHTYLGDFRVRCLETALAYTSVLADVGESVYPEDQSNPRWTQRVRGLGRDLRHYWRAYDAFDGLTTAQTDSRLRNFLNLSYQEERQGDVIHLKVDGGGEGAWFILRTHHEEIAGLEGGSFEKLEEDAFLIRTQSSELTVTLKAAAERRYQF